MGIGLHPAWLRWDIRVADGGCGAYSRRPYPASIGGDDFPTREPRMPMRRDHFLDFHRAAESAGYPAMLIVSVVALGVVVAPLVLLALTGAGWLLGVTLLGLIAAIALLAGEFNAAVSDGDEPPRRPGP